MQLIGTTNSRVFGCAKISRFGIQSNSKSIEHKRYRYNSRRRLIFIAFLKGEIGRLLEYVQQIDVYDRPSSNSGEITLNFICFVTFKSNLIRTNNGRDLSLLF